MAAGVLSGAFGVGGGIVTTPAIRLLLGCPALIAVGTPLPVIVPTALAGAWSYWRAGLVDVRAALTIGAAGIPVTVLGAWLSDMAGGRMVLAFTAALIAYMAVDVAIGGKSAGDPAARPERGVGAYAILGTFTGLYSGFLGLGGGFVIVPLLTRVFGMSIKRSIGTSLLAVCLLAVPGTITHWYLGHVDVSLALMLMIGVVPGALLGARLTRKAGDTAVRYAFSGLLAVTALVLVANEFWFAA
ncbi:MAG: sulfite exporter TauE/SafE family protein [Coriobacteriia bacterium]